MENRICDDSQNCSVSNFNLSSNYICNSCIVRLGILEDLLIKEYIDNSSKVSDDLAKDK